MPRSYLLYLEDRQPAVERIARYGAGLDFATFSAQELVPDGMVRNPEITGEAAKKVPAAVQQQCPRLPWAPLYRRRNRTSHEYFGPDLATGWRVVTAHLPQNYPELVRLLAAERQRPAAE